MRGSTIACGTHGVYVLLKYTLQFNHLLSWIWGLKGVTNWYIFNLISLTLCVEENSWCHHFCVRLFFWYFLKMKDTCLVNGGRIKVANNFTQRLAFVLYNLETQTLIAENHTKILRRFTPIVLLVIYIQSNSVTTTSKGPKHLCNCNRVSRKRGVW
jgi:hypothetical protein